MKLEASSEFLKLLPTPNDIFNQMLNMKGRVYRQLEARETVSFLQGGKYFFVKKHFGVGWREIFKNLSQFKIPVLSAKNEMLALKKLNEKGILTPDVLAYGEKGLNPANITSFVVMNALENCISLEDLCHDWPKHPPEPEFKKELIKQVATVAKTMHQLGINHRDFYICHFLLQKASKALYLIDLHRAQIRKKVPIRWLVKDLSGLYFSTMDIGLSKEDLLYFLEVYFEMPSEEVIRKHKELLTQVEKKAHDLYRKEYAKDSLMPKYFI